MTENNPNETGGGIEPDLNAEFARLSAEAGGATAPGQGVAPSTASEPPMADVLEGLISTASAVLAPAWNLQAEEVKALAEGCAPVLEKYFPDMRVGVELNAALIVLAIIGPRLSIPRKRQEKDVTPTAEAAPEPTAAQHDGEEPPIPEGPPASPAFP